MTLVIFALAPPVAFAQGDGDKALAAALFQEGKALMAEGKTSAACAKLQESFRLDPGGGTILNLATCHETEGKVATAWAEFGQALSMARRDNRPDRIQFAEEHLKSLEARLARLVVQVPPAADLPELQIMRDGAELRRPAWGTPVPLDPGEHTVEARAPGRVVFRKSVTIPDSATTITLEIPQLALAPAAPSASLSASAAPPPPPPPASAPPPASSPPSEQTGPSAMKIGGFVALGLGAVGLGLGTYFGVRAIGKHSDSNALCPTPTTCRDNGAELDRQAGTAADISTVAFIAGGASAALGVVLLVIDGRSNNAASTGLVPIVTRTGGSLSVSRSF